MERLKGKTALVTGSTPGLGLAMAGAFIREDPRAIIVSRKVDAGEAVTAELRAVTGAGVVALVCEVGHWDDVANLVATLRSRGITIDVLVNNAGIAPTRGPLVEVTEEFRDKTLGVHLKEPYRLGALVGDYMIEHGGVAIINSSSVALIRPKPEALPYAVARVGSNALTMGLAHAHRPSVRGETGSFAGLS